MLLLAVFFSAGSSLPSLDALVYHSGAGNPPTSQAHVEPGLRPDPEPWEQLQTHPMSPPFPHQLLVGWSLSLGAVPSTSP